MAEAMLAGDLDTPPVYEVAVNLGDIDEDSGDDIFVEKEGAFRARLRRSIRKAARTHSKTSSASGGSTCRLVSVLSVCNTEVSIRLQASWTVYKSDLILLQTLCRI